jgi:acyl-CoA reductase-like NAD-dependent aldehyde dehydrogenase
LILREPICAPDQEVALVLSYNINNFTSLHLAKILLPGNRVVVRLSAQSATVGRLLEDIWRSVFPDDVRFDFSPAREFMRWCVAAPSVRAIILFASENVAFEYEEPLKASEGKRFIFEGPGKDPFIVLDDADYRKAARSLAGAKYIYSGQACWSPERVLVHEDVHDDFIKEFVKLTRGIKVGEPLDPTVQMGPVVDQVAVRRIKAQVEDALSKGGRLLCGGSFNGLLIEPVVIDNANRDMIGMREESFGPISFVQTFSSGKEAVALAQDSPYGLHAAVWGWRDVPVVVSALAGEGYLHEVESIVFGKYGMMTVNSGIPLAEKKLRQKGTARIVGIGGYGYSGWAWDSANGALSLRQGPKAFDIETSLPAAAT